ncbi:MAG: Synechococcus phage, partial [Bacteroidota bacterium]
KLVIFDLDGVLIDSKNFHYEAFNKALASFDPKFIISTEDHVTFFDGLPTKVKLQKLHELKEFPSEKFDEVWKLKQIETINYLKNSIIPDISLIECFRKLKENEIIIAVASNSIRTTVELILEKLGLTPYVDLFLGHEDVSRPKPFPEIYWKCMIFFGALPSNTVILEDSHIGRKAASDSKCTLIPIINRKCVNMNLMDRIINLLGESKPKIPWRSPYMNVLIPMAGSGSRFSALNYTFPKPLIDVRGKPMIQVVVDNLNVKANFIFIVQKEHYEKYNLQYLLPLVAPDCKIIQVDRITEGAACTTLLAKDYINNNQPLLLANSDQFIDWNSSETLYAFENNNSIDGAVVTFTSTHPKWSYAKIDSQGYISEVAEKKPISNNATAGIYFWKKGSDYVKYAEQMINKNIRINNEFYVCPVFNEAINDNKKFIIKQISKESMWGIGTPEDLNYFLEHYKGEV